MKRRLKMKTKAVHLIIAVVVIASLAGCGSQKKRPTAGFLSDYSRLEPLKGNENYLVYINRSIAKNYDKFMIDPVKIHFVSNTPKLTEDEQATLCQYLYKAFWDNISDERNVTYDPGPGVGRLRVAITDLKESNVALNLIPHTKLTGVGLGRASMEAELVDSLTGEQIAATIRSQSGNRLALDGLSKWGDMKAVMDGWAKDLKANIVKEQSD
jgi:hypothetical protein